MEQLLRIYKLGDMQAVYILNGESQTPELLLLPEGMEWHPRNREHAFSDSLLQLKLQQDGARDGYSYGVTLRQGLSVDAFLYDDQELIEDIDPISGKGRMRIETTLKDKRGYEAVHTLSYVKGDRAARSYVNFKNKSKKKVVLEMLSSFSLGKMSPIMYQDGYDTLKLHRIRSCWSMEGRLETRSFEELQLEPSWGGHAVRCERFGAVGNLPVNKYFPTMAIEDSVNGLFWGASIAHNASWQLEVYRRGDDVQMSGGLADREFGHWVKIVKAGESFQTPEAIVSVCRSNTPDLIFQRMTSELTRVVDAGPICEQSLPIVFNEYCTTWGNPNQEKVLQTLDAVKNHDIDYYVIDAGWYRTDNESWSDAMGDYNVSRTFFPDGLLAVTDAIHDAGLKAGLWFEIDNVANASQAYQNETLLLKRDGKTIETSGRRFRDLRKKEVQDFLSEKVIGTLKKNKFDYIKVDCNDSLGIGCDGAESLAEGLRQNQLASIEFFKKMKAEIPGIIIENCASGGHKLEPLTMSYSSMGSFSDAHECPEIPIIAANLHRVVLPRQSQIWAVIRKDDSPKRLVYSMAATFLGRMGLSGDMNELDEEQWKLIDEGIMFYRMVSPVIKNGYTKIIESETNSWRHPKGWQAVFREQIVEDQLMEDDDLIVRKKTQKGLMVIIHAFEGSVGTRVKVQIPIEYTLKSVYSHRPVSFLGRCEFVVPEDNMAVALYYVN